MNRNGIGLGLNISMQIVKKLGGEISFTSKYQQGSTFKFSVKLEEMQSNESSSDIDQIYSNKLRSYPTHYKDTNINKTLKLVEF